jgi:hypothetical protein
MTIEEIWLWSIYKNRGYFGDMIMEYIFTLLFNRLTVIPRHFLCLTWLLRNFKRWQPHMWMPTSRLGGWGGGIHPPKWKLKTCFLLLFLFARKSLMTGFTWPLYGHRYSKPSQCAWPGDVNFIYVQSALVVLIDRLKEVALTMFFISMCTQFWFNS